MKAAQPVTKAKTLQRTRVADALAATKAKEQVLVKGWVRTRRDSKQCVFLEINDGSCLKNLQVVVDAGSRAHAVLDNVSTGASVSVRGKLVASPAKGQQWEIQAEELKLIGAADQESYPLQKKRHSDEFLRTIAQLRPRTNKYGALNRIRSELAFAVHKYFHDRGFFYVHTPVITGSDCEGAGELFQVTTFPLDNVPRRGNAVAVEEDFFGKPAYLTVSGQLAAEAMACSLGDVYTFGPTFRAENSNTPRHAAEFWMIEPEVAFADLGDIIDLAEDFVRTVIGTVRSSCREDLELFFRFVDTSLPGVLDLIEQHDFVRLPYGEAIDILAAAGKKTSFEFEPGYGLDLQTEHERYLVEEHFHCPVVVYDYPKSIKPFYMRLNPDGRTVAAMDLLLPRVGELIGGSQREERLDVLEERLGELGLPVQEYRWYLDLRRYGTVPHGGFGLGFERLLMFLTGVTNIRDVIPFCRTPKHLEF